MKSKLRVLMIEDSHEDAVLIAHELGRPGYEITYERVDTERTLKQALARGDWDVVLCDYTMPKFSGAAALHIVRQMEEDLPFIYVSGTIGEDVAVEAMKSGVNDYVMKNNLKRLVPSVEHEIDQAEVRKKARITEEDRNRLIQELEAALKEVKRLSGLLPICANCKRIRLPDGSWEPIEIYIQERSEAQFSHGLCPECHACYERPPAEDPLNETS